MSAPPATEASSSSKPPAAAANGHASKPPKASLPQKRYFRQRAHVNVLADHSLSYPRTPRDGDWAELYPHFIKSTGSNKRLADGEEPAAKRARVETESEDVDAELVEEVEAGPMILAQDEEDNSDVKKVEFADIGCGYGGLMSGLGGVLHEEEASN
jgi:tRNA (guanine-N7-)-methyltransferase